MKPRALIALSGGVDSSVTAHLVREAGYDISGATMLLYDNETIGAPSDVKCGSAIGIEDARKVAAELGISHYVCDYRSAFREAVIGRFIRDYESGNTPNPCVECNKYLKFDKLYEFAWESGYEYLATGHYAIIEQDSSSGRYLLRKAKDLSKDQSYFLYKLSQEQLAHSIFPLGNLSKEETREIARELGIPVAEKKESQDICFIPGGDYVGFIEQYTGKKYAPGDFVDESGNRLGEHRGIISYTIGQRKGLGLALKKPMYVTRIDTDNNRVILGENAALFQRELTAHDMNWIMYENPEEPFRASARIRYRHAEAPCLVMPDKSGGCKIIFDEAQRAITSGQSVVIYDGDYVVGGGIID